MSKKPKRRKTAEEKRAKREHKKNFMMVFMNGRQKWIRRPPTIEGLSVDEFIARNADPIWLHQNEMWDLMEPGCQQSLQSLDHGEKGGNDESRRRDPEDVPF